MQIFESILVPEKNEKQKPDESYTKKYQKHAACSYSYKLLCVVCSLVSHVNHI